MNRVLLNWIFNYERQVNWRYWVRNHRFIRLIDKPGTRLYWQILSQLNTDLTDIKAGLKTT